MSWTDERIKTLTKMWESGATASQIADELGEVSRNAVIGKAHRLSLKARPSPVKPNEAEQKARTAKKAEAAPVSAPAASLAPARDSKPEKPAKVEARPAAEQPDSAFRARRHRPPRAARYREREQLDSLLEQAAHAESQTAFFLSGAATNVSILFVVVAIFMSLWVFSSALPGW